MLSNNVSLQEQIEAVRKQAIEIFAGLCQQSQTFDVSPLPAEVQIYQKRLGSACQPS